jgi:hypothetical protein
LSAPFGAKQFCLGSTSQLISLDLYSSYRVIEENYRATSWIWRQREGVTLRPSGLFDPLLQYIECLFIWVDFPVLKRNWELISTLQFGSFTYFSEIFGKKVI